MSRTHIPVPADWARSRAHMFSPAVFDAILAIEREADVQKTKVTQTIQPDGTVTWTSNNVRVTLTNDTIPSFTVSLMSGGHVSPELVTLLANTIATECGSRVETPS